MYYFYMGKVLLPVPPSKIQTIVNNQNKTMNLMNEGEVNVLKSPGLTTIKFDLILPMITKYPFAMYKNGEFLTAAYFLEYFEKLKTESATFQFIISRWKYVPTMETKKNVMKTNMTVTLESFTITEDSQSAPDITVSIELKQYIKYGTITREVDTITNTVKKATKSTSSAKALPNTYTVVKGDTLWAIAKKLLGDGAKCWNLAKLNNISNPNKIQVGQVIKIQDVKATTAPATNSSSSGSSSSGSSVKSSTATVKTATAASLAENLKSNRANTDPLATSGSKSSGYGTRAGNTTASRIKKESAVGKIVGTNSNKYENVTIVKDVHGVR